MSNSEDESDRSYHVENNESDESIDYTDPELGRINLEKLKRLRGKNNCEMKVMSQKYRDKIFDMFRDWEGKLPNLHDVFEPKEMNKLLIEFATEKNNFSLNFRGELSIGFVARTGYKDKSILGKDGKPSPRRTTAVHHAVRRKGAYRMQLVAADLFQIFNRFDVNYTDEYGLTHFHAACIANCEDVVKKFLEFELDPNYYPQESIDPPLHLALTWGRKEVTRLLLERGADVNLANRYGSTPLHIICQTGQYMDDELTKMLFEISDKKYQVVKVDAPDKLVRTPLQWAVASLAPNTVDLLLGRGANLSNFVFPTASYFGVRSNPEHGIFYEDSKMVIAAGALAVVECLEKRGYKLDRSDALTIMKLFARHEVFEKSADLEKCWYDDEKFASEAKKLMMNPSLSLHDFIRLPPEKAQKVLTCMKYMKFLQNFRKNYLIPDKPKQGCIEYLCEVLSRGFLRHWALEFFLKLTRNKLPILCCEMVFQKLKNEDLCNICLATIDHTCNIF